MGFQIRKKRFSLHRGIIARAFVQFPRPACSRRAVRPGSGGGDRLRIFLQNRQPAAGETQADNAAIAETMRPKQGERKSFDLQVERVQCSAMAGDKDVPIFRQLLKGIQKTSGAAQHGIQAFAALRRRIILRRFKKGRTGRAKRAEIAAFPNAETNLDQAWVQLYFFFGPARDDTCGIYRTPQRACVYSVKMNAAQCFVRSPGLGEPEPVQRNIAAALQTELPVVIGLAVAYQVNFSCWHISSKSTYYGTNILIS